MFMVRNQLRIFTLDLNYASVGPDGATVAPSAATDWKTVDPFAFCDWQVAHGANVVGCQPWTFSGFATFPSELGPRATGTGGTLFPAVYDRARDRGVPILAYFNVAVDLAVCSSRPHWLVPGSQGVEILGDTFWHGFLDPQSRWADLLADRILEFLSQFKPDWVLFDWFCYGSLMNDLSLPSTPQVRADFGAIIGKAFPEDPGQVSSADAIKYKREVLARWFARIRDAVRATSPVTKIVFNVPYFGPAEPIWVDHVMLRESDALFAESSNPDIVEWLLSVRRPGQRVMTTIFGRPDDHVGGQTIRWSDASTWRHWSERDCDLVAWTFPVPPSATPHPRDRDAIKLVGDAYRQLARES